MKIEIKSILKKMGYAQCWLNRKVYRDNVFSGWYVIQKSEEGKWYKNHILSDRRLNQFLTSQLKLKEKR